jgi:hypothetical protein
LMRSKTVLFAGGGVGHTPGEVDLFVMDGFED